MNKSSLGGKSTALYNTTAPSVAAPSVSKAVPIVQQPTPSALIQATSLVKTPAKTLITDTNFKVATPVAPSNPFQEIASVQVTPKVTKPGLVPLGPITTGPATPPKSAAEQASEMVVTGTKQSSQQSSSQPSPQPTGNMSLPGQIPEYTSGPAPTERYDEEAPVYEQPYEAPFSKYSDIPETPAAKTLAQAATVKLPEPSFLDKVLAFFGLKRTGVLNSRMAGEAAELTTMSRTEAAQSLVRRANNGDQNAMGILVMVRERALQGDAQARISMKLMESYARSHIDEDADIMAGEDTDPTFALGVKLSHGPTLVNSTIEDLKFHHFDRDEEVHAFEAGMNGEHIHHPDPVIFHANRLGKAVAWARNLQGVGMEHTKVSNYNDVTGWELGE